MILNPASESTRRLLDVSLAAMAWILSVILLVSVLGDECELACPTDAEGIAEGGQLGDAGRFEAPVPDEVPKIEMRKVGDARVSPLHYGDDAAEGV
jgi:hypothetical protein